MSARPELLPPGLVVRDLSHRFGDLVAADRIDLEVRPGQVHCLLGPSGSGKSTLLRLVAGLETLQQGSISINGRIVADHQVHRGPEARAVGFVFQDYALFPHLDVRHNVMFGMRERSKAARRRAAERWLARVGMTSHATAMPHTLSGGQQQRIALARALAREPAAMLLDEPFSGLDDHLRGALRRTTLELLRGAGVATLMVTHDPREALLAGDLVSVIRAGRIAQTGRPEEVYARSATRQVAEVFGPINRLLGVVDAGGVATPWGRFDAPGLEDGREVEVLVRPSAVELSPPVDGRAGAVRGRIARIRLEGALVRILVTRDDGSEPGHALKCYDLARRGWTEGAAVVVTIPSTAAQVHALDRPIVP